MIFLLVPCRHVLLRDHVTHCRLQVNSISSTQTVNQSRSSDCCSAIRTMVEWHSDKQSWSVCVCVCFLIHCVLNFAFYGLLGDGVSLVLSWESFNFFLSVLLNNTSVSI